MEPGIHGVRKHWIRGFMAFQLTRRPMAGVTDGPFGRTGVTDDPFGRDLDSRTAWVSAALSHVHLVSIGAAP
jgi:hypothetical protein